MSTFQLAKNSREHARFISETTAQNGSFVENHDTECTERI